MLFLVFRPFCQEEEEEENDDDRSSNARETVDSGARQRKSTLVSSILLAINCSAETIEQKCGLEVGGSDDRKDVT